MKNEFMPPENILMNLGITQETRIVDLQKGFNTFYPYLKLEFYKRPSRQNKILQKAEKINPHEQIQRITRPLKPGIVPVEPKITVSQVVEEFWKSFGLATLVFRKSGNLWIETSLTDSWSLEKQNKIGESFSNLPNSF